MPQRIATPRQIGQVLTARRKALKLSQEAIAAKLGISQNRLSELEADPSRLTLDRLIALANLLDLDLLLQDKGSAKPQKSEW